MARERRGGLLRGIPLLLVIAGPFLLAVFSSVSAQAPDVQLRPKVPEDESVTEAWIAWYDYNSPDFNGYVINIWGPSDSDWRDIGTLSTQSSTSVRIYGLKPLGIYNFLIQVQDTSGGRSGGVSTGRVMKPDVTFLPTADGGIGPDWVELRWKPSSGGHFEAYVISKDENGSGNWQTVGEVGDQGQGSYRVGGLRSNTGYDFRIQFRSTSPDNGLSPGLTTTVTTEKGGTFGSSSKNPLYDLFATPGAACGLSFFLFIIVMSIFANVQKKLGSSKAKFAIPIMIFALLIFVVNGGLGLWYLINEAPLVDFSIQVAFFEMALVLTVFFTVILLLRAKFRYADAKSFAFFTPIFGAIFVMSLLFILSSNGIVGGLDQYQLPILIGAIVVTVGALAFIRVRLILLRKRNEAEMRETGIREGFEKLKKQEDRAKELFKKGPYPEVTEAINQLTMAYAALTAQHPEQADSPLSAAASTLDRGESKASRLESLSSDVSRHEERLNKMRIYGGFDELAQAEKSIETAK
ncbi:MAG TPA: fibronectin type III domain-containing protein, partial [Thermoplasmata archaeon]|nr:fibronectin type III domain-containing protein [Thermoplasmata archaeon]